MMQTLIAYSSNSRVYLRWIEMGKPDESPDDLPFKLPKEARKGDRYLFYVGGVDQAYVGHGVVTSHGLVGRSGAWKGVSYCRTSEHMFRVAVPGADVFASTGFKIPRRRMVVDATIAPAVWKAARGKPLTSTDRAVEGILTETRSKSRNAALRQAALARAAGVCECCGTHYPKVAAGLGTHCLVVHHKKQLKDTDQPVETKLTDLAVVCANCHMMIHANPAKALTLAQLRKKLVVPPSLVAAESS